MTLVLRDHDYAAIVKRYEDAGDVQNADIIRRQQQAARAGASTQARPKNGAGQCIVLGGQRIGTQHLLDLQRDAARYRWLRDKADSMACTAAPMVASLDAAGRVVGLLDGEELDAAVDMAAAQRVTKTKTKRGRNQQ